ncbi:MarR family winged helix-turn-helix transcriptional regulator [Homoserinibacter sp. YIM 151385]|uniref:MarR family winged helix-turn-helix transcriptional regulator n=1 Tax=Homoserinibacter sp. YIM 151385 TaxID=2985506 RepID=UPI0022F0238A|nr:MarR family winged helix-turn-helix transcriptional regulator [Homoserinibacter sp. YIM 151385]WBU37305.1 MarR family winged helix-turn-helix transcriptional regulator [Homoserinibacter sp. YIM 151385]
MARTRQDPDPSDPIVAIEQALMQMRRDQQARMLQRGRGGPGGFPGGPGFRGRSGGRLGPDGLSRRDAHADSTDSAGSTGSAEQRDHLGHGGHHGHHGHGPRDRSLGGAARFRLLDALEAGPSTVSDLAARVGVDQPRASRLVAEAVDHGFARRGVDPADARRAVVELTEAGRSRLHAAHETRRDAVATAVEGFSDAERAAFAELLTRFVAAWPRA